MYYKVILHMVASDTLLNSRLNVEVVTIVIEKYLYM